VYKYFAFGLSIESEIYFPELFTGINNINTDVQIKIGAIDSFVQLSPISLANELVIDQNYFYLNVAGIGKYYATAGNLIIIEPYATADLESLRLYCLSNVFAAILFQRQVFPLHAAALKIENKLVLICGDSGAGKSSLQASLPYLSSSGEVFMHPSYPIMKFWRDTLSYFPFLGEPDVQLRPNYEKFGFFFHDEFQEKALRPSLVFFLEKSSVISELHLREIKGVELFQKLDSNVYRGEFLGQLDLRMSHFELFSRLANQLQGYVIERPTSINTINELSNKVEEIIRNKI
jgi:energy-coupling factor transporter ATP-binding protein EcfA2